MTYQDDGDDYYDDYDNGNDYYDDYDNYYEDYEFVDAFEEHRSNGTTYIEDDDNQDNHNNYDDDDNDDDYVGYTNHRRYRYTNNKNKSTNDETNLLNDEPYLSDDEDAFLNNMKTFLDELCDLIDASLSPFWNFSYNDNYERRFKYIKNNQSYSQLNILNNYHYVHINHKTYQHYTIYHNIDKIMETPLLQFNKLFNNNKNIIPDFNFYTYYSKMINKFNMSTLNKMEPSLKQFDTKINDIKKLIANNYNLQKNKRNFKGLLTKDPNISDIKFHCSTHRELYSQIVKILKVYHQTYYNNSTILFTQKIFKYKWKRYPKYNQKLDLALLIETLINTQDAYIAYTESVLDNIYDLSKHQDKMLYFQEIKIYSNVNRQLMQIMIYIEEINRQISYIYNNILEYVNNEIKNYYNERDICYINNKHSQYNKKRQYKVNKILKNNFGINSLLTISKYNDEKIDCNNKNIYKPLEYFMQTKYKNGTYHNQPLTDSEYNKYIMENFNKQINKNKYIEKLQMIPVKQIKEKVEEYKKLYSKENFKNILDYYTEPIINKEDASTHHDIIMDFYYYIIEMYELNEMTIYRINQDNINPLSRKELSILAGTLLSSIDAYQKMSI